MPTATSSPCTAPTTRRRAAGTRRTDARCAGTLHWVSAEQAVPAEVRLYDRLFKVPDPAAEPDLVTTLNEDSRIDMQECQVEPEIRRLPTRIRIQFERQGYFCQDTESAPDRLIFNRTVSLRDTWEKIRRRS